MKKILIVDDEEKITDLYGKFLTSEGYKVFGVNSAPAAYEFFNKNMDLILLDINMPEVRGDEFYEVLKIFNCTAKVIVTSVLSLDEQQRVVKGADGYHDKSEGIEMLLSKIKEVFKDENN